MSHIYGSKNTSVMTSILARVAVQARQRAGRSSWKAKSQDCEVQDSALSLKILVRIKGVINVINQID